MNPVAVELQSLRDMRLPPKKVGSRQLPDPTKHFIRGQGEIEHGQIKSCLENQGWKEAGIGGGRLNEITWDTTEVGTHGTKL